MVVNEIDILLARYFAGELSPQDEHKLEKWLAESEENEKYFFELTSIYQNVSGVKYPSFTIDKALEDLNNHIEKKSSEISTSKRKQMLLWVAGTAAAVAGLLITLNLWNGYRTITNQGLHTANNAQVDLINGEIRLSKNADNDTIYFTGVANFKIDSQKEGSKIVKTGEVYIKDIGTRFTVDSNNPDSISVSVDEGEVLFYSDNDIGINLRMKDSGYYLTKNKTFYKIAARGNFNFQTTSLEQVVNQLNLYYGNQIVIKDESIKLLPIHANFQNEEVSTILDIISIALNIKIEHINNRYVINKH